MKVIKMVHVWQAHPDQCPAIWKGVEIEIDPKAKPVPKKVDKQK